MEQGRQVKKVMAPGSGPAKGWELVIPKPKLKLMDQVREVLRVKHYAIRTEQAYCDWIRRYVRFHGMRSREDLFPGTDKVELFLSDLAVNEHVAASTQNQAFNALLFLYGQVLHQPFENVQAVRADRPVRVPVVLTPEEVRRVLAGLAGTPQLVAIGQYFLPATVPPIHALEPSGGITWMRRLSKRRFGRRWRRRGSPSAPARTRSGTASRPTPFSAGPTSAPSRSCRGTTTSPRP